MLAISFAVLAAAFNAVGAVLQRAVGRGEPDRRACSIELLVNLLRSPVWVAGVAVIVLGFLAQTAALALGEIAEVQPLLVAELPFALLFGSVAFRMRPRRSEWVSIAALTSTSGAAFRGGSLGVFSTWQTYRLFVLGRPRSTCRGTRRRRAA